MTLSGSVMCQCCIPGDTGLARVLVMLFYCHLCVFLARCMGLPAYVAAGAFNKRVFFCPVLCFYPPEGYLLVVLTPWFSFPRSG